MPSAACRVVGRPQRPAPRRRRPPSRPPSTSCNVVFWTFGSHRSPARILACRSLPARRSRFAADRRAPTAPTGQHSEKQKGQLLREWGREVERGGSALRTTGAAWPCYLLGEAAPPPSPICQSRQAHQFLGASARARLPPFSHDNGATSPSRQRSLTGAPARSAMPPTSTPLPPSLTSCPIAFPNAQQWALWAPIAERQAEIFGRAASGRQECEQDSGS